MPGICSPLLSACLLLLAAVPCICQVPVEEWNRTYGGPHGEGAWALQQTSDGGFILAGYSASQGRGSDLWLLKTDSDGRPVWSRTFGGSGEDAGYSVLEDEDGYVIAGSSSSYGMGEERLWLLKTDRNGSLEWDRVFGGFVSSSGDGGWAVDDTEDGYIVTGYTRSTGAGGKDLWLIRTGPEGDLIWERTFGGPRDDVGMSVSRTVDGGFILAGRTASFGSGGDDIWLLKTDAQGREVWNRTFGGKGDDVGYSVLELHDGYIISGKTESGSGGEKVVLIRTDSQGLRRWQKVYDGSAGLFISGTTDGGFLICGHAEAEDGTRDALLIRTGPEGDVRWSLRPGGSRDDIGTSALQSDKFYVVAGITSSFGSGAEDAWLIRLYAADETEAAGGQSGRGLEGLEKIFKERLG